MSVTWYTHLPLISKRKEYLARFIFMGPILLSLLYLRPDIIPENSCSFLISFRKWHGYTIKSSHKPLHSKSPKTKDYKVEECSFASFFIGV